MRITEHTKLEELVAECISAEDGFITLEQRDYDLMKDRYGNPCLGITTGDCDSAATMIEALKSEIEGEDFSSVRAIMMHILSSKENGITMGELGTVNDILNVVPEGATKKRSIGYGKEEKHKISLILWK